MKSSWLSWYWGRQRTLGPSWLRAILSLDRPPPDWGKRIFISFKPLFQGLHYCQQMQFLTDVCKLPRPHFVPRAKTSKSPLAHCCCSSSLRKGHPAQASPLLLHLSSILSFCSPLSSSPSLSSLPPFPSFPLTFIEHRLGSRNQASWRC